MVQSRKRDPLPNAMKGMTLIAEIVRVRLQDLSLFSRLFFCLKRNNLDVSFVAGFEMKANAKQSVLQRNVLEPVIKVWPHLTAS